MHEDARHLEQAAERVEHERHGVAVGQVVAGVDDEVWLEVGQPAHPVLLAGLARREMQVAEVQHPQRAGAGRQQRHLDPPHGVETRLVQRVAGERHAGHRPAARQAGDNAGDPLETLAARAPQGPDDHGLQAATMRPWPT